MSHTAARRSASVLGAAALFALLVASPASARPDPGTGGPDPTHVVVIHPPGPDPAIGGNVEYLQIGVGVLAGVALAGTGAALVSRRRNHGLTVA